MLVGDVPAAVGVIADAFKPKDLERVFGDLGDVDLIVNAITVDPPTRMGSEEPPEKSASMPEVAEAVKYLLRQTPAGGRTSCSSRRRSNAGFHNAPRIPWPAARAPWPSG